MTEQLQPHTLYTGNKIPSIGFGTGQLVPDEVARSAVAAALECGFRLVDTAARYNNEASVGAAIQESRLPRDEIFVTTKLWHENAGYDETLRAFDASLEKLWLQEVDLYLVHWPTGGQEKRRKTWQAMERLYDEGRAKAIGVSNYSMGHLEELFTYAQHRPAVNQVEFHPAVYEQQRELVAFCQQNDIVVEGYSTFAGGQFGEDVDARNIASKYDKNVQQVLARWSAQHGVIPLVRSRNPEHIAANRMVEDFQLTDKEMALLDTQHGRRLFDDPAGIA